MKTQFDERNLTMVMDLYEMTMANGYFVDGDKEQMAAFDVFFRTNPDGAGFSIFAGLEQVVEFLENMHFDAEDIGYFRSLNLFDEGFLDYLEEFRFKGDIYAFGEGTVMYPYEPVMTVVAPIIDAQLIETAVLAQINHQSLVATKARRIVKSAKGRAVTDFGARRAHNMDAAVYGARAAYIGGAAGTATVLAGQMFGIPVGGTAAHSWIMKFPDELTAFRTYARLYPDNCILLADTYSTLGSGVPNAIKVFQEMQKEGIPFTVYGIRLDSGDLAYDSKHARKMLDEAGFQTARIVVSNGLDEYTISSILEQGGCIDSFGVGERLITAKSDPVFGAVYKLAAIEENGQYIPKIKISNTEAKITNPGLKDVYRIYDASGHAVADLIAKRGETIDLGHPFHYVDPQMPWKNRKFDGCSARPLQELVMKDGKRTQEPKSLRQLQDFVEQQLSGEVWEEEQRFENPHLHFLDMTPDYYELKMSMLHENSVE